MSSEATSFDMIEIVDPTTTRQLTTEQFLALPLPERITSVLQERVRFHRGQKLVDARVALAELRQLRLTP